MGAVVSQANMILSILVPVYNEEKLVGEMLGRLIKVDFGDLMRKEIILVDDGSVDGTHGALQAFKDAHPGETIKVVRHEANRGKGAAVRTAMAEATGEVLIIQDADLEYEPAEIPEVVAPVMDGRALVVYGSRILKEKSLGRSGWLGFMSGKHPDSYSLAYLGGVTVTRFINLLAGTKLTDAPTCYKCFHRDSLQGLTIEENDFAWEPEVTMKLLMSGVRILEVPISYFPRRVEEGKKINWRDGLKALATIARYRFKRGER
jgi:dolichol-phosphate mannosyltransferase